MRYWLKPVLRLWIRPEQHPVDYLNYHSRERGNLGPLPEIPAFAGMAACFNNLFFNLVSGVIRSRL